MKQNTLNLILTLLFTLSYIAQSGLPPGNTMSTTGPINTTPFVPQGSPLEMLGSAANAFLNIPAANLTAGYIFPGDTVTNNTKMFANMLNSLNNFLYVYTNFTEPSMVANFNQIFGYANQSNAVLTQNLTTTYAVPAKAAYYAYLNSTNRSLLANISANLTNTVNYYASVNNLTNITNMALATTNALITNTLVDLVTRNNSLIAANQTQNALLSQQGSDYNNLNLLQQSNLASLTNNINFTMLTSNASLIASGVLENANWNGAWTNAAVTTVFSSFSPPNGFQLNQQTQNLITSVYATVQASVSQFMTASTANFNTNNLALINLDNQVNTFVNALNQFSSITTITPPNATQFAQNNTMLFQGISNDTFSLLMNLTNQPTGFSGQRTNQIINGINAAQNTILIGFNAIMKNFAPNSVEAYSSGLIQQQITSLCTGMISMANLMGAFAGPVNPTLPNYGLPAWFNPQSGSPLPNTITPYVNYWAWWNPLIASSQQLQSQYMNINQALQNLPISAANAFNVTTFMNPFNQLLNTLFNATNPFINFAMNMSARLTNYTNINSNMWQMLQQNVTNFKNQVSAGQANFSAYLNNNLIPQQLVYEVALNKANSDSNNLLSGYMSAHTNYLTTVLSAFSTSPQGLLVVPPTATYVNFPNFQILITPNSFHEIDACLVTALSPTCPQMLNFYLGLPFSNLNLTNVPNFLLSTYLSTNATFPVGNNGVTTGYPASNPLYYNSVVQLTPSPPGTSTTYWVGQGPQAVSYVLNVVYSSPTYVVVQLQASSNMILNSQLALNVTLVY